MDTMMLKIRCPECGVEQPYRYIIQRDDKMDMVLCDSEEGGCEIYFVVLIKLAVTIHTGQITFPQL